MGQAGEIASNLVVPIVTAAIICAVALGLGALIAKPFYGRFRPPLVESFALGTLAISLLTLLWGSLNWMEVSGRWALAFPLILLSIIGWVRARPASPLKISSFQNRTILSLMLLLVVGVLVRIILTPLHPPFEFDECTTHLPAAKAVVDTGRIAFHPDLIFNSAPQNAEMLFVWAIADAPLSSAHCVNFLAFLFSLLAVVRLGRMVFSLKVGWLAALIMATLVGMQHHAVHSTVDIWMLFYLLAAILAGCEAVKAGAPLQILLVGVFMGAAAGVKYTGLVGAGIVFLSLLAVGKVQLRGVKPIPAWIVLSAIVIAILVALPWYLRNYLWFHNPFFPYYTSIFAPGEGTYAVYAEELAVSPIETAAAYSVAYYFEQGQAFNQFLQQWFVWGAVPAGIWYWRKSPFMRVAITWTILSWFFWLFVAGGILHYRYFFYLIPVNVLAVAHLLVNIYVLPPGDRLGRFLRIVLWVVLVLCVGILGARNPERFPPLTLEAQAQVLSEKIGSYDLILEANRIMETGKWLPEERTGVGILCEDARLYADFSLVAGGEYGWANHAEIAKGCSSAEDLADLLHKRYNATLLIVHEERLYASSSGALSPLEDLMVTAEFHDLFRQLGRVGSGAVYFVGYPGRETHRVVHSDPE